MALALSTHSDRVNIFMLARLIMVIIQITTNVVVIIVSRTIDVDKISLLASI